MKKKILFLLAIFSFFFIAISNVKAIALKINETPTNKTIIQKDEEVLNLYYYKSAQDSIIYNYDSTKLSIPSYEELSYFTQNGNFILNLPVDQWNRVELLAYYGYGYMEHTDLKWYEITQYLIWNTLEQDYTWNITDPNDSTNHYEVEIKELNNLVKRHLTFPSFAKDFLVLKENEQNVFTDDNHVLHDYIIEGMGMIRLNITEDEIVIEEDKNQWMFDDNEIMIRKYGTTGHYTKIYLNPRYKLIGRGDFTDVQKKIPVYIGGGNILLKDGEKNSTYEIQNEKEKIVDVIQVGELSRLLPYGSYRIKASNLPSTIKDENVYVANLNQENSDISIIVEQENKESVEPNFPHEDLIPDDFKEEFQSEEKPKVEEFSSNIKDHVLEETLKIENKPIIKEEQTPISTITENKKTMIEKKPELVPNKPAFIEPIEKAEKIEEFDEREQILEDTEMKEILNQQSVVLEDKKEKKDHVSIFPLFYLILVISTILFLFILKKCKSKK